MTEEGLADDTVDVPRFRRARQNWRLIASMVALHPKPFAIAVAGAALFAACTVLSSFALEWVIDEVIMPRFEEGQVAVATFATGAALVIGIGVVRAVGVVVRRSYGGVAAFRIAATYSKGVVAKLVAQPVAWHRRQVDGDLVARAGVDADGAVSVMRPIPFATGTVLMIVMSTIWLFTIDVQLGLVAVVAFPLLVATNIVYERLVEGHFARAQGHLGDFSAGVHESFEGVQLIKAYGAEAREADRLAVLADDVRAARVRAIHLRSWFEAGLDLIPSLTNIALVVIGVTRVDAGEVSVGEFTSVVFLFTLLVFPLRLIGFALSELPRSMAAWKRIHVVLDDAVDADPRDSVDVAPPGVGVSFEGVSYRYAGDERFAVDRVELELPVGSITALVGPTGSGKSTVADLAIGLVAPSAGTVRLAPGKHAMVFQEAFLFHGTVRDNVDLLHEGDDAQVWRALELAAAVEFVRRLPNGLDTLVGERGVSLSGGQRQRIALARALFASPSFLVLDDTTSALDPRTEAIVLDNIRHALATTTVMIVASRPSTIALADRVVLFERGRAVASGTHAELLSGEPRYASLVEAFESDRSDGTADLEVAP